MTSLKLKVALSRRELVRAGLALGVGGALPALAASAERRPVITKAIPSTGERLAVVGDGANDLGAADYADVRALLRRMNRLGGSVIDTASQYGQSEAVIGRALAELGLTQKMFIATKFNDAASATRLAQGPGADAANSVSGLPSVERSLQRLHKIDLLFAHHIDSVETLMPIMMELKRQRRIRYLGFTSVAPAETAQVVEYINKYPIDFLQLSYSLGDRWAEATLLPLAQQRRIAVMAARPLGGHPNGTQGQHDASSLLNQINDRQLPSWAAQFDAASWGQFFLKYVVSHPAITCAIPGSTKLVHLEDNQAAGLGRLPDAPMRRRMERFWNGSA